MPPAPPLGRPALAVPALPPWLGVPPLPALGIPPLGVPPLGIPPLGIPPWPDVPPDGEGSMSLSMSPLSPASHANINTEERAAAAAEGKRKRAVIGRKARVVLVSVLSILQRYTRTRAAASTSRLDGARRRGAAAGLRMAFSNPDSATEGLENCAEDDAPRLREFGNHFAFGAINNVRNASLTRWPPRSGRDRGDRGRS